MAPTPQTQRWPADRAILFVHGVGNASVGDYAPLVEQVQAMLGDDARRFAFYFLYYDEINDWFAAKNQAGALFEQLIGGVRTKLSKADGATPAASPALGNAIAEFAGDVLWPVLLADARTSVRTALLNQLRQIVRDGENAGKSADRQHISIIAHSMGCFHTYEAVTEAARNLSLGLSPVSYEVQLANVIYMASPVSLIRGVAREILGLVPRQETLHSMSGNSLWFPAEATSGGSAIPSARRTVSITGDHDPVGGYLLGKPLSWAVMDFPAERGKTYSPLVDEQQLVSAGPGVDVTLAGLLQSAIREGGPPDITPQNPHDWYAYMGRHAEELKGWLTA